MAKIHPNNRLLSINSSSNSSFSSSSKRETFTVWMKSLVFNGNGCTVFNSSGELVYRVDNYQKRCSSKVFLMNCTGQTLFSIYRKKLGFLGCWEGFKHSKVSKQKPWFEVRRNHTIFGREISCRVIIKCDENSRRKCYKIEGCEGKSAFKIMEVSGKLMAEAVEKQSSEGIPLGRDVLNVMVEPHADQALMMALLTIYGLINNRL